MKNNKSDIEYQSKFEIVLQIRDLAGNPTGRTQGYKTDNSTDLDEFYQRNCYREKKPNEQVDSGRNKNRKSNKKATKPTPVTGE